MTASDAAEMISWQYAAPYDIYNGNPEETEETTAWLLTPRYQYHAIKTSNNEMIGFCCFGEDATVPGGHYTPDALDIGLGIRPDLTSRGLGPGILQAILDFAIKTYEPSAFRATIATFNIRSQRLFRRFHFVQEGQFTASSGREFVIVRRPV